MTEQTREEMQAAGTHPAPCARMCEAQAFKIEIRSLTRENATLRTGYDAARLEIASLQAQLEAVGAGGVGRLAPDVSLISEGDMPAAPAQPVAWALQWPDDSRLNLSTVFDTQLEATDYLKRCSDGGVVVPLYAAPQPAAQPAAQAALAEKWQVVPRQLTQDMAEAAKFVDGRLSVFKYADAYRAMLAAAPTPPLTHIGETP